jgi:hypothetical protein
VVYEVVKVDVMMVHVIVGLCDGHGWYIEGGVFLEFDIEEVNLCILVNKLDYKRLC